MKNVFHHVTRHAKNVVHHVKKHHKKYKSLQLTYALLFKHIVFEYLWKENDQFK